jgi:hypothetical protein
MAIESICWCVKMVITTHLTYSRILAVCIAIQFTLKAVILNFSGSFSQVSVNFLMTDWVINFNACLP